MKRYIKCSNATFPLDIYEFLDWFNDRNPDYKIYNDDVDLVSCNYSSETLARFPRKLEVSESEAKDLEQKILDALHKFEDNALSGNIDSDYIEQGLRNYLVQHISDLNDETIFKLIDYLYSNARYKNSCYSQLFYILKMPGLSKATINKLKSTGFNGYLAAYNPDLSKEERIEILIPEIDEILTYHNPVSDIDSLLRRGNYVPDEVLRYVVLNAKQPRARAVIARQPNLSPDIVDLLKNDKSVVVRRAIDKNY